jgi:hypothetical protein
MRFLLLRRNRPKKLTPDRGKNALPVGSMYEFPFFVAQASLEKIEHLNGIAFGNR